MRYIDLPVAFAAASIMGGVLLTLLSGFYMAKPLVVDAEIIYFGFPFPWLEAGRGTWTPQIDWRFLLIWQGLFADFVIYGFVSVAGMCVVAVVHQKQKV